MGTDRRRVLVTGATGQQGGAVARALLAMGHEVRAMVRDPKRDQAVELTRLGAEVVVGDMEDTASIARAARGADAMFAVTSPYVVGTDAETTLGVNLVDGAVQAGVRHFVYSSVASANRETGIPHFESKWAVERHLAGSGLDWTVTGPVFFFENVASPWQAPDLAAGRYRQAMPAGLALQMIGVGAVGSFNAHVIDRGRDFYGDRIDIAADALTGPEAAAVLSDALGREISFEEQPIEEVRATFGEDVALMFEWFQEGGFDVDVAGLRSRHPGVAWASFPEWAARAFRPVKA